MEGKEIDILYHLGLDTTQDLSIFKDVKFVCMGGSAVRAASFAEDLRKRFTPDVEGPPQPVGKTERYHIYKVGSILSASHGIGMPSMLIMLHEVAKLLHYAGATNVQYIRIGTCGGIGSEPGTVCVTTAGCIGTLEPVYEAIELGERKKYSAAVDSALVERLIQVAGELKIPAVSGMTMGTDDFYEAQGRLDGALRPSFTEADKMAFLKKAYDAGVRNIEMESTAFAAFCQRAKIRGGIICAALVNRLNGDQVTSTPQQLGEYSLHAQTVVSEYMWQELHTKDADDDSSAAKRARCT